MFDTTDSNTSGVNRTCVTGEQQDTGYICSLARVTGQLPDQWVVVAVWLMGCFKVQHNQWHLMF